VVRSIILKKRDRGEADELVFFLARDLGWLHGIAKNSRKSRVRFGGHLEPFSVVDLVLRPRRRDSLVWIDDAQVVKGFLHLRSNIRNVALASYFFELASIFQAEGHPDPELFDFLSGILENLESSKITPLRFMLDEIRLLGLLGYEPRFDSCAGCGRVLRPGQEALFSPALGGACHRDCVLKDAGCLVSPDTLAVVRRGLQVDPEVASRLRPSRKGMEELRNLLSSFVRYLRGQEVNSLLFLENTGLWRKEGTGRKETQRN
jgi:DNA repair protein RecO (recombination protein O)